MVRTVSGNTARFTIWSHRYIQTRQIGQDVDRPTFSVVLKQQQNGLNTDQAKGVWPKQRNDWTRYCAMLSHLLSPINECKK
jgi:hypothetical protein